MKNEILDFANLCSAGNLKAVLANHGIPWIEIEYNDKGSSFSTKGLRLKNNLKAEISPDALKGFPDTETFEADLKARLTQFYANYNVDVYTLIVVKYKDYSDKLRVKLNLDIRYVINF